MGMTSHSGNKEDVIFFSGSSERVRWSGGAPVSWEAGDGERTRREGSYRPNLGRSGRQQWGHREARRAARAPSCGRGESWESGRPADVLEGLGGVLYIGRARRVSSGAAAHVRPRP